MSTNEIRKTILLHATPARVWRALSDSQEFGYWFGVKFNDPFMSGATMVGVCTPTKADPKVAEMQKAYEGARFELTVDQMVPEKVFSFRWHPFAVEPDHDYSDEPATLVVFAIEATSDGVHLTISESGFDDLPVERRAKAFSANDGGWTMVITLIDKYLANTQERA